MMKIGIISDTHNLLREEVEQQLRGCEQILHAGDISSQEILDQLENIAPVTVVRGNNDKEWAENLPLLLSFEMKGIRIFMTHKKKDIPAELSETDLVIYGHSHKYEEKTSGNLLFLNPGSCGPRRFGQQATMVLLYIPEDDQERVAPEQCLENILQGRENEERKMEIKKEPNREKSELTGHLVLHRHETEKGICFYTEVLSIPVQAKASKKAEDEQKDPAALREKLVSQLPFIMADIQSGKTTAQLKKKYQLSEELVQSICRMYLTHPGVDADGILRRLGLL